MKLVSPHKFRERILLFGGGGVGKTTAVLSIAQHVTGTVHVIDADYSFAYERALATDFRELDNVEVHEIDDDWESLTETLVTILTNADPENDWVVIDPFNLGWDYVQAWMSDQVHGVDIEDHLVRLRAESDTLKEFQSEVGDSMNWPLVTKTFTNKLMKPISRWRGHLVLVCEATRIGKKEDDESKALFGHLGLKPAGHKRTHHICSTNLLLMKKDHGVHKMTTAKDRNRPELENQEFDDFGWDYLRDVAGWEPARGGGDE